MLLMPVSSLSFAKKIIAIALLALSVRPSLGHFILPKKNGKRSKFGADLWSQVESLIVPLIRSESQSLSTHFLLGMKLEWYICAECFHFYFMF